MKTYTKGAKRRAKQAMPDLAPTPKRNKKRGRARMAERADEAQSTVLEARARQMGLPATSAQDMKRTRLSEQAGMALDILCDPDDATRLWGHYIALTASEARYHRSMGLSIDAKTAKIEMMQERFETRPDDQIDLRSQEERDIDAAKSWGNWRDRIAKLDLRSRSALVTARRSWAELVQAGQITPAGRRFVEAMERMDAAI